MAVRRVAALDAVDVEGNDLRLFGFRPEGGDDGMQRAHPVQFAGAPAHRLRPRKRAHDFRHHLGDDGDGVAAFLLGDGDIEVALLVGLHLGLIDRGQARRAQEAGDRLFGRADLGTFALFLEVGRARRHALHGQRQTARRGEGLGALIDEARRHQPVGDHFLQVIGGARLHARRDFLGEKFEQQIGHGGTGKEGNVSVPRGSRHGAKSHLLSVLAGQAKAKRPAALFFSRPPLASSCYQRVWQP